MRHATLVLKVTRLCNLRCDYCHDWRAGRGHRMGFRVLAHATARALREPGHQAVTFIWHGGEPTVLPIAYFEKALAAQAQLRRDGQLVRNILQTNGTRLTPEWVRFLRTHEIGVGVSIDGPPEVHDRRRRHVSGRGSFDDVMRGLDVLRRHGVPFGVLAVLDEATLEVGPDRMFDFFVEHAITEFGFNAATPDNDPHAVPGTPARGEYVEPQRANAFLARIYDRWVEHGDPAIRIRELDGLRLRLRALPPGFCKVAGGCLGDYFIVEPDGDVAHCDLFLGDPSYRLGNVLTHRFGEMRDSPAMAALRTRRAAELERMAACPRFSTCNGWCPHEQYLSLRHDAGYQPGCCGLRDLIDHMAASEDVATAIAEPAAAG